MQRLFLVLLFLLSGHQTLLAQTTEKHDSIRYGITGGVAFFSESYLKQINTEAIENLPFNVQMINNFPSTICSGGYILIRLSSHISIGPSYQFYTTGSRLGAKDYSGSYSFDQIISAHSLGIQAEEMLMTIGKSAIYFENILGIHLVYLTIEEKFKIDETEKDDKEQFNALKPFIYPGLKFLFPLSSSLGIAVKAGYSLDLGGFELGPKPNAKPATQVSFSGPRLTVAIEYGR